MSRISDIQVSDMVFYHMNLFGSTVRMTHEVIVNDFIPTCVDDTSSGSSDSSDSVSSSSSASSASSASSESSSGSSYSISVSASVSDSSSDISSSVSSGSAEICESNTVTVPLACS